MFGRHNINIQKMGRVLNAWVNESVDQIFYNDSELARCGLGKNDDVFYELNSAFLFVIVNLLTDMNFHRKQLIIDEMHNLNIEILIKREFFASNETIDYRRCLSQTYKDNSKFMKMDNWMNELSKAISERTGGRYEDDVSISVLAAKLTEFYKSSNELLKKYKDK